MHVKCVLKYGYKSIRRVLIRNRKYLQRRRPITAGRGGIRDATSATPYAPAESIGPMLPPPQANTTTSDLSSVQIGTRFASFDRFLSLKQHSDWHLLCVFRPFSELKAAFRLARSKNGRKTTYLPN